MRGITDDERALMVHVSMFGSDGYPINKYGRSGRRWSWGPWRGVSGPPTMFATRRAAVAHFESFMDVLRDAHAGRI